MILPRGRDFITMGDSRISRRQLLQTGGSAGLLALAGCMGGNNGDETSIERNSFELAELPPEYVLSGQRLALMPRAAVDDGPFKYGQQFRVGDPEDGGIKDGAAVFTVRQEYPVDPGSNQLLIGEEYTDVLESSEENEVVVAPFAPHPDLSTRHGGKANDEYIEQVIDDGEHTDLVAIAPHGGQLEPHTGKQALRVSGQLDVSAWAAMGFDVDGNDRAHDRWFVPDTNIHPAAYPKLAKITDRGFTYAISFHSYHHGDPSADVSVGGLIGESNREQIRDAIEAALKEQGASDPIVDVPRPGTQRATSSDNVVNWITEDGRSGVEIRQSEEIRDEYWFAIADGAMNGLEKLIEESEEEEDDGPKY